MIKLVVFDLDNVIIDGEAIDEIGKLANVEDEIAEITEKAMQGESTLKLLLKIELNFLKELPLKIFKKLLMNFH